MTKHEIREVFINSIAEQYKLHNELIPEWLHIGDIDFELHYPILDKIRAEIEKLQKMCDKSDLNLMAQYSAFGMVLDIIDKYKAESEGKE